MSELLPCPFCGGEPETLTAESMHGGYLFGIMCNDCCSRGDVYDNEAEAIAAWNSRAERVTDDEWESYQHSVPATEENMAKYGWVRERTCRNTSDSNYFRCSVCRKKTYRGEETFNYCPNCGRKVVSE